MRARLAAICVSALLEAACHGSSRRADGAQRADSGTSARDAGPTDAKSPDSGTSNADMARSADAAIGGSVSEPAAQGGAAGATRPSSPAHAGAADGGTSAGHGAGPVDITIHVTVIVNSQLATPSDLAFNPYVTDELWVVNHADSSATIIQGASTATPKVLRRQDPEAASHFMPQPLGLAFGGRETTIVDAQGKPVEGTFATCPEDASSFMGPTLWTSDLRIFGIAKEDREPPFNGPDTGAEGPGSHIDMLHRTPTCLGIDWEGTGNIYWTYSGKLSMFVRYDYGKDHGIGNSDHTDGSVWRYAVKGLAYVPNTPSQLVWDPEHKRVYLADAGNARVVSFDPSSATMSKEMSANDNVDFLQVALDMSGGKVKELVSSAYGLKTPSGLALREGRLYVSDAATGTIHKFDTSGAPLGAAVIPGVKAGALAGMSFGPDGKLYFVDMVDSRVLRLENAF